MTVDLTDPGTHLPHQTPDGVRFTFRPPAGTHTLSLAGTFNSWVGDELFFHPDGQGLWSITLPIPMGRHLYKLVLNGQHWMPDPHNPWISEDGQNNSCITVTENGGVLVRNGSVSRENPGHMHQFTALKSPDWLQKGVVYQFAVQAFGGTFKKAAERLPGLADLGISVLWMMPVFPVGERNRRGTLGDPYAVQDFSRLDPALGTEQDFQAFIDQAHLLGMKVLLDWTLNRSSCDHPWTRLHPDWYSRKENGEVHYRVPNREDFAGFDFSNPQLRSTLIQLMQHWLGRFSLDGFRFDDSDITPLDFLEEIRATLLQINPGLALISQAYDEFHHLQACDLTYEGSLRELVLNIANGIHAASDLQKAWEMATYSFPRGALRMRWIEEKEQQRAFRFLGRDLHFAAATLQLTLDGVPALLMGQEGNEPLWDTWTTLFEPVNLDPGTFDPETLQHYQRLIHLRKAHPALHQGTVDFVSQPHPQVVCFRRTAGQETLQVTVNLSQEEQQIAAPTGPLLYGFRCSERLLGPCGTRIERLL